MSQFQRKFLIVGFVAVPLIAGAFFLFVFDREKPPDILSFKECVNAGNPVMESYPRQCRTSEGKTFIEVVEQACKNQCGDGVCQEIVCQAVRCPCVETPESCSQDCSGEYPEKLMYRMERLLYNFARKIQEGENRSDAYAWARERGVIVGEDGAVSIEIERQQGTQLSGSVIAPLIRTCGGIRNTDFILEDVVDAWIPVEKLIDCALQLPEGWFLRRVNSPVGD